VKNNLHDPITAEVVRNALQSIAEEMGVTLVRSAYSSNIKERRDCSCALFDSNGDLIALAEHIPIHLGSMQGLMTNVVAEFDTWGFSPGDVVIANDPYRGGGSHLPDVTLIKPIFDAAQLVAFAANIAHWSDIGGRLPGVGTAGDSTEVLQEGLRIPPTRILQGGEVRQDVLDLILLNTRGRDERLGDFRAQLAALALGERRVLELLDRYGFEILLACIDENYAYSERLLREALQQVPAGTYRFREAMDDDGVHDDPLPIHVAVSISHQPEPQVSFDFDGTADQAAGGINMVWSALLATVQYAVKALFAPDVPTNAGFQRPIQINAPQGSLVNATEPAPVGGRTDTCQHVVDAIMGALRQAVPEKVVAASNGATTAIIFGGTQELSGQDFVYVEALGGGMGARFNKDGMDGVQVHITNTSNLPVEAMELEYPLRVLRYELVTDSGGPGKFRGGMSIRKEIQALKPILFSAHSDRHRLSPWGLDGGGPGGVGCFVLNPSKEDERSLPSKLSGLRIQPGQVLRAQTAGAGGYGPPDEREPDHVSRDVRQGKISPEEAHETYKVVLKDDGTIDQDATRQARENDEGKAS
jgi:N-methylhydantoinase B